MTQKSLLHLLDTFLGKHSVQSLTREIHASIQAARPRAALGVAASGARAATSTETAQVMRNLGSKRRQR